MTARFDVSGYSRGGLCGEADASELRFSALFKHLPAVGAEGQDVTSKARSSKPRSRKALS